MKALSLTQPWASLLADGQKTIECRSWNTPFRGEFLIHSTAKRAEADCMRLHQNLMSCKIRNEAATGAIIGHAWVTGVKTYENLREFLADVPKHLAPNYFTNADFDERRPAFGFQISRAEPFMRPVKCRGMLNFWPVSDETLKEVKRMIVEPWS